MSEPEETFDFESFLLTEDEIEAALVHESDRQESSLIQEAL